MSLGFPRYQLDDDHFDLSDAYGDVDEMLAARRPAGASHPLAMTSGPTAPLATLPGLPVFAPEDESTPPALRAAYVRIPAAPGHAFRSDLGTDSGRTWARIPEHLGNHSGAPGHRLRRTWARGGFGLRPARRSA